ncbi:hypothetical protein Btru_021959 [Bulinus truncatus]|nr:hypothetical protein Btru_021959 [Bulinus truncatus]
MRNSNVIGLFEIFVQKLMYDIIEVFARKIEKKISVYILFPQASDKMFLLSALLIAMPALIVCQTAADLHQYAVDAFHVLDLNADGNVQKSELDHYFVIYDSNHDGQISRHEYTVYITEQYGHDATLNHLLHNLYDELDTNGDHHLNHVDWDNLYTKSDADGNGLVNQGEFTTFFEAAVHAAMG